jgi:hypothetical protein
MYFLKLMIKISVVNLKMSKEKIIELLYKHGYTIGTCEILYQHYRIVQEFIDIEESSYKLEFPSNKPVLEFKG